MTGVLEVILTYNEHRDLNRNLEIGKEVESGATPLGVVGMNGSWKPWEEMRSSREFGEKEDKQAGAEAPTFQIF